LTLIGLACVFIVLPKVYHCHEALLAFSRSVVESDRLDLVVSGDQSDLGDSLRLWIDLNKLIRLLEESDGGLRCFQLETEIQVEMLGRLWTSRD